MQRDQFYVNVISPRTARALERHEGAPRRPNLRRYEILARDQRGVYVNAPAPHLLPMRAS